jgi:hypothetical protein
MFFSAESNDLPVTSSTKPPRTVPESLLPRIKAAHTEQNLSHRRVVDAVEMSWHDVNHQFNGLLHVPA